MKNGQTKQHQQKRFSKNENINRDRNYKTRYCKPQPEQLVKKKKEKASKMKKVKLSVHRRRS